MLMKGVWGVNQITIVLALSSVLTSYNLYLLRTHVMMIMIIMKHF